MNLWGIFGVGLFKEGLNHDQFIWVIYKCGLVKKESTVKYVVEKLNYVEHLTTAPSCPIARVT